MTNEKRLIDANAFQFEPDPWGGMNGVLMLGRSGGKTMATVQAALKRMIDNAHTVDAVEVVRCKDCKYINREIHAKGYGCLCDAHSCDREGHERYLYVEDDDFCSYGERREGE